MLIENLVEIEEVKNHIISEETGRDLTVYGNSMDAATEAKVASVRPYFGKVDQESVIVDVGAGTGQVAGRIAEETHTVVFAVDYSHDMLDLASKNLGKIKLVQDDATELKKIPSNSVDVIHHGTVGHEIQTFKGMEGLSQSLLASYRCLKPGGREVWRDFLKPPEGEVFLEILTNDGVDSIEQATIDGFLDYSLLSTRKLFDCFYEQFKGGNAFAYSVINQDGRELIKLPAKYAQEFILRKDYTANWRQEIKEEYTYWTQEEAKSAFEKVGFEKVEVFNDDNEYIRKNRLDGKVVIYKIDEQGEFRRIEFITHMVIVGQKAKENENLESNKNIETVDFQKLLDKITIENGKVVCGNKKIKIGEFIGQGQHKKVYEVGKNRVLKIVKNETTFYSAFASLQQAIERQYVLDNMGVKYMKVCSYDKEGPPYRYLIQERIPEGSVCVADLIRSNGLIEEDVAQMAEIINKFELGKEWQLDLNPFNWFKVNKNGKSEMVYTGGTVYRYNEAWSFDKVGLLQWTDSNYINKGTAQSAKLPSQNEATEFAKNWELLDTKNILWWKKYLNTNVWPK
jgi:ubiquinone/menaquinone biosynthesis C-methylase UbiE